MCHFMDWYFNIIKKNQLFPNCSVDSIQWRLIFKQACVCVCVCVCVCENCPADLYESLKGLEETNQFLKKV